MDAIETLTEAARSLTPDQLRNRLVELNREARIIKALLRASLHGAEKQTADRRQVARP